MNAKDLQTILARAGKWPKDARDELMRSAAEIEARYARIYHLDDSERSALKRSADDVRTGRFASSSDVDAVLGRFHRA